MLNNENKHNGLEMSEIRDFLGKGLMSSGKFYSVESLMEQINELKERLNEAKKYDCIVELIKSLGWEDFDVSDDVYYDNNTYFNFVGTKKEYDKFMDGLK